MTGKGTEALGNLTQSDTGAAKILFSLGETPQGNGEKSKKH